MNLLRNFKIGARLNAAFATALLLLCLTGMFGAYQSSSINQRTVDISTNWLPSIVALAAINDSTGDLRRTSIMHTLEATADGKKAQQTSHDSIQNIELPEKIAAYEKLISSPPERQLYENMRARLSDYLASDGNLIKLSNSGAVGFDAARALASGESTTKFHLFESSIDKLIELNNDGANDAASASQNSYRQSMLVTFSLIGLAALVLIVLALSITRSITKPIQAAVELAENVSRGDLRSQIAVSGRDEISVLLGALAEMNSWLTKIVARVRDNSQSIASGADQIAVGNMDLSQRTEEQAASLEETAASMEELTTTVKQNAENARHGNELAANASQTATDGGKVVGRVVSTMNEISRSSAQVAQIITVIEGIAFQTNILALNAAVEAARAGEQGRGFAVVAGEVRTLAQRSATAAKEIKDLISEALANVAQGSRLADEAGTTMDAVVKAVSRVTDLMGDVSVASTEQQTGIEQINRAVMQMDEVTQQNAALVEEASAAAQSMAAQSSALREIVSVFKLGDNEVELKAPKPPSATVEKIATNSSNNLVVVKAAKPVALQAHWESF